MPPRCPHECPPSRRPAPVVRAVRRLATRARVVAVVSSRLPHRRVAALAPSDLAIRLGEAWRLDAEPRGEADDGGAASALEPMQPEDVIEARPRRPVAAPVEPGGRLGPVVDLRLRERAEHVAGEAVAELLDDELGQSIRVIHDAPRYDRRRVVVERSRSSTTWRRSGTEGPSDIRPGRILDATVERATAGHQRTREPGGPDDSRCSPFAQRLRERRSSSAKVHRVQIPFNLKGVEGRVDVTYEANSQPESIGCRPEALGFPMCTATVQYPMRGYDSLMGWVQLVRSDDNASRGEQFESTRSPPSETCRIRSAGSGSTRRCSMRLLDRL